MFEFRFLTRKLALIIGAISVASAFAFNLSVKSSTTASQIFVGDRFDYEIDVNAPESVYVDLPSFVGNLGSFEVKDMQHEEIPIAGVKGQ